MKLTTVRPRFCCWQQQADYLRAIGEEVKACWLEALIRSVRAQPDMRAPLVADPPRDKRREGVQRVSRSPVKGAIEQTKHLHNHGV